jgi:hypothetical protein
MMPTNEPATSATTKAKAATLSVQPQALRIQFR